MTRSWIDDLEARLIQWQAQRMGGTWVVAVSGGSDSVGLLRVLHALAPTVGLRLSVAHLDHGVRGPTAQADAAFVAEVARSLDLPFDLGHWCPSSTTHFESSARRARYAWLSETALARGATVIAVGHTRDDQAETILHRIVRGTGLRGLAGMRQVRKLDPISGIKLVRPLLTVSRASIREYLAALSQTYHDDETNADQTHTRSRIRHDLLPKLAAEYNPNVATALVQLGKLAQASQQAIASDVRSIARQALLKRSAEGMVLKHGHLQGVPTFLRTEVLRFLWRRARWPEAGMSAERWGRIAELVGQSEFRPVSIGARVTIAIEREFFLVLRRSQAETQPDANSTVSPADAPTPLTIPGITPVPWAGGRIITTTDPNAPRHESINPAKIEPPLMIRQPTAGDRFEPLGMNGQSTPLADFFRARKVPRHNRSRTPLLCDARGIVWVVGHRISERVKLTSRTDPTIGLSWER